MHSRNLPGKLQNIAKAKGFAFPLKPKEGLNGPLDIYSATLRQFPDMACHW
jgi:hypothetical protein